ncbi:DUF305 domain-containing protein [Nocardiopsis sp. HNM0947]|uniref:DUF305 domain-containing protein n=1 Tax=Nocardiopsis coralli TaxID=2772213 RepID=A0ABR9P8C6_9ACTN|nr:DUF305 domain-containing protein [Nocardiopsis coralli]MBE3000098.1 DUF305 domain-containing protein [Nocardiopsis coralli]
MEHNDPRADGSADSDGTGETAEDPLEDTNPEEGAGPEDAAPKGSWRSTPTWMAVTLVVLALVAGYLAGRPSHPLDTSADAGFLRDMSAHHAQAVDMSMVILDKTDDPQLHTVATDMARTQQAQIGIMQGWLMEWELPSRGPEEPMAWMAGTDHDHGGGEGEAPERMPGLATDEQLVDLDEAEGEEAEIIFLELMIDHHQGGIDMAEAEAELGSEDMVVDFAQGMVDAQQSEIDLMERMLGDRGVDPED